MRIAIGRLPGPERSWKWTDNRSQTDRTPVPQARPMERTSSTIYRIHCAVPPSIASMTLQSHLAQALQPLQARTNCFREVAIEAIDKVYGLLIQPHPSGLFVPKARAPVPRGKVGSGGAEP
jgi:hypothetical protein